MVGKKGAKINQIKQRSHAQASIVCVDLCLSILLLQKVDRLFYCLVLSMELYCMLCYFPRLCVLANKNVCKTLEKTDEEKRHEFPHLLMHTRKLVRQIMMHIGKGIMGLSLSSMRVIRAACSLTIPLSLSPKRIL